MLRYRFKEKLDSSLLEFSMLPIFVMTSTSILLTGPNLINLQLHSELLYIFGMPLKLVLQNSPIWAISIKSLQSPGLI
jgi:hypothetical protein